MVRQAHLIALVVAFLIGGTVLLLVVGCAGVRSESPKQQGHTEATREQTRSTKAASEEARCAETRLSDIDTLVPSRVPYGGSSGEPGPSNWETNDVPGCLKGGPLLGTASADKLYGGDGDDEIRGLGAKDNIYGGLGSDVIYGGPGKDSLQGSTLHGRDRATSKDVLYGGPGNDELIGYGAGDDVLYGGDGDDAFDAGRGEDVLYGGDGNDVFIIEEDGQRDNKLYCGEGRDKYYSDKNDYVDSSCENKIPKGRLSVSGVNRGE